MRKKLTSVIILAVIAACTSTAVCSADAVTDAAKVERQSASLEALQQAASQVGNHDLANIKVDSKAHQILITVVGSKLNNAAADAREVDASKIASAIASAITDKPEFSQIAVIHVDYVELHDELEKIVQGFDFYKGNTGIFSLHNT